MVRTGKLNISSQVKLLLEEDTANRQYGRLPDQDQDQDNGHLKEMTSVLFNSTMLQGISAREQYGSRRNDAGFDSGIVAFKCVLPVLRDPGYRL